MNPNLYSVETEHQIKNILQKYAGRNIGFTCSAFDLFHCGHVLMLEDAKTSCDILVIGLHTNPNIDRQSKNAPIQEYEEREIQISGSRYVDEVITYATEDDLMHILKALNPDVRIIGTDWKDKPFTGHELPICIKWHQRNHEWSTTYLRERVYKREVEKKQLIEF